MSHIQVKQDLFTNSFIVGGNLVMLVTLYNINLYSENLCLIKSLSVQTINTCIREVHCCSRDASGGFLLSCEIEQEKLTTQTNVYEGENIPESCCWAFRA